MRKRVKIFGKVPLWLIMTILMVCLLSTASVKAQEELATFTTTQGQKGWDGDLFDFTTEYGLDWDPLVITVTKTSGIVKFTINMPADPGNFDLVFDGDNDGIADWLIHWCFDLDAKPPRGTNWTYKERNVPDGWMSSLAPDGLGWGGDDSCMELPSGITADFKGKEFTVEVSVLKLGGSGATFRFALQAVIGVDPSIHPGESWSGECVVVHYPLEFNKPEDWILTDDYQQVTIPKPSAPEAPLIYATVNGLDVYDRNQFPAEPAYMVVTEGEEVQYTLHCLEEEWFGKHIGYHITLYVARKNGDICYYKTLKTVSFTSLSANATSTFIFDTSDGTYIQGELEDYYILWINLWFYDDVQRTGLDKCLHLGPIYVTVEE